MRAAGVERGLEPRRIAACRRSKQGAMGGRHDEPAGLHAPRSGGGAWCFSARADECVTPLRASLSEGRWACFADSIVRPSPARPRPRATGTVAVSSCRDGHTRVRRPARPCLHGRARRHRAVRPRCVVGGRARSRCRRGAAGAYGCAGCDGGEHDCSFTRGTRVRRPSQSGADARVPRARASQRSRPRRLRLGPAGGRACRRRSVAGAVGSDSARSAAA
jgi:hypothetical protein